MIDWRILEARVLLTWSLSLRVAIQNHGPYLPLYLFTFTVFSDRNCEEFAANHVTAESTGTPEFRGWSRIFWLEFFVSSPTLWKHAHRPLSRPRRHWILSCRRELWRCLRCLKCLDNCWIAYWVTWSLEATASEFWRILVIDTFRSPSEIPLFL